MADIASLYAPGTLGDEPAAPRPPGRPTLFLIAAFAMTLIGPGALWFPWRRLLINAGIAADGTWGLELLGLAPALFSLFWGLLSDRWAILDARREGHLFCAALLATTGWVVLLIAPRSVPPLLIGVAMTAAHSIANVAIGGALAEIGRRRATTGRLAAAWSGVFAGANLTGVALHMFVGRWPLIMGLSVSLGAFVAIAMVVSLGTDPVPAPVAVARTPLRPHLRTRAVWGAAAVVILGILANVPDLAIAPGTWPRPLGRVVLIGLLAGAGLYAFTCRRLPFARAVRLALVLNVVVTIAVMRASEQPRIVVNLMVATVGLVEGLKFAALNDLILRASPPGHEASVGALLSAVAAIGWAAPRLIADAFGPSLPGMTTVAVVAGAAAVFASSLLPASLVERREGGLPSP